MSSKSMAFLESIRRAPFTFSLMVKAYRTRESLTQKKFALIVGVKNSHISNIENQKSYVTIDEAIKFATALNEPVNLWIKAALKDMLLRAGYRCEIELKNLKKGDNIFSINERDKFLIDTGFEVFFKKYGRPKAIDSRDLDNSWYVLDYTDEQMLIYNILNDFREIISKHL